ncbi:SGNH/GDSL hydrolase family protein [Actinoplanes sp. NPDC051859]|uniref:SGNH/GDSL hydrolase family protein n=1 Tax=Actinoplanes sp. NPDC051859 TaxID=3363909 RepID=UPI0037A728B9
MSACGSGPHPPAPPAATPPPSPSPAAVPPAPLRVMLLGDSITGSPGCWRAMLWRRLPAERVDFVGSRATHACGTDYDDDNEGHSGFLATAIANRGLLPGWVATTRPDIVLMHLGTNDVWHNQPLPAILDAFTMLITQLRAANPAIRVVAAQILPMKPANCEQCGQRVADLNAALPGWAAILSTPESPITLVDQWTGFDTATNTSDGVHPNRAGDRWIADRWYPALLAALD